MKLCALIVLLLSLMLVSGCAEMQDSAEHPKPELRSLPSDPTPEYTYMLVPFSDGPGFLLDLLQSYREDGWELVNVFKLGEPDWLLILWQR